jgi:hypothetical protein
MPATDQLFKEVLQQFLFEFLALFFPDIAAQLDRTKPIRFRDKEVFTDFPEGERREADIIAEVYTLDGDPEIVLLYLEVQGKRRRDFPSRMFVYCNLIGQRTGLAVFPIVIYLSPGAGGITQERYMEILLGRTLLTFEYAVVDLPDLAPEDYASRPEALAVALSAAMGTHPSGVVEHKWTALRAVATSGALNAAQRILLASFVEVFLPLASGSPEASEFERRLSESSGGAEVRAMINIYEERGFDRGMQQGMIRGVLEGKREAFALLYRTRFGELPASLSARLDAVTDVTEVDSLFQRLATATTPKDLDATKA